MNAVACKEEGLPYMFGLNTREGWANYIYKQVELRRDRQRRRRRMEGEGGKAEKELHIRRLCDRVLGSSEGEWRRQRAGSYKVKKRSYKVKK